MIFVLCALALGAALIAFMLMRIEDKLERLSSLTYRLREECKRREPSGILFFGTPVPEGSSDTGGITAMSAIINTNQKVSAQVRFTDDEGNEVNATNVTWSSDSPEVADVEGTGTSAVIHTGAGNSPLGAAVITATDNQSGISVSGVVEVTAGEASTGEIVFGAPEAEDGAEPTPEEPPIE